MSARFTVLASGSSGNASFLEVDGFGLLIDAGLGPRQLSTRLNAVGATWKRVSAVLLTHTHSDHWKERTIAHLRTLRIPLYCHVEHHGALRFYSPSFPKLQKDRLARTYETGGDLVLHPAVRCRPLPLRHDGGLTFGFRIDGTGDPAGRPWSLAYLADLGCWTPDLAQAVRDVDLLALEFNHDVGLEYSSGRSPGLINRVLGDDGHLSNEQAAALLHEVVRQSAPGRPLHVVQLHLSRECNRPSLAVAAARSALRGSRHAVGVYTAAQDRPTTTILLGRSPPGAGTANGTSHPAQTSGPGLCCQRSLPGFED